MLRRGVMPIHGLSERTRIFSAIARVVLRAAAAPPVLRWAGGGGGLGVEGTRHRAAVLYRKAAAEFSGFPGLRSASWMTMGLIVVLSHVTKIVTKYENRSSKARPKCIRTLGLFYFHSVH